MMGPDVSILTHTHNIERTDIPQWDNKGCEYLKLSLEMMFG